MAARDLRYEWFDKILKENSFDKIAIAQHLDDSIETFMINLTRGTGIQGLTGISNCKDNIIRPLLFAERADIIKYATKHNLKFVEDKSNNDIQITRNYFRHEIIPKFLKINKSFKNTMKNNFRILNETETIFKAKIAEALDKCTVSSEDNCVYLSINELKKLNPQYTYLYEFLNSYGINSEQTEEIIKSLDSVSGKKFLTKTHLIIKDRNCLIISKKENIKKEEFLIKQSDSFISEPFKIKIETLDIKDLKSLKCPADTAIFDYDKLQFPLKIRKFKTGDYFYPLGMRGRKKISDFFIDSKINLKQKNEIWLLTSNNNIIWIVGYRTDNRYCVDDKTKRVMKLLIFLP